MLFYALNYLIELRVSNGAVSNGHSLQIDHLVDMFLYLIQLDLYEKLVW